MSCFYAICAKSVIKLTLCEYRIDTVNLTFTVPDSNNSSLGFDPSSKSKWRKACEGVLRLSDRRPVVHCLMLVLWMRNENVGFMGG